MANQQIGNIHGLTTPSRGDADSLSNISGTDDPEDGFFDANLVSISAMKQRLRNIDPGLYTEQYLNMLTTNDMVYAIRLHDASYTFNDVGVMPGEPTGTIQALITEFI